MYINAHTYYSLRYGVLSPQELLRLARENNCLRFAVTDINTTSACLEMLREASRFGVIPIPGVDFRNGVQQQFIMLAKNNEGFRNINYYLSELLHHELEVPDVAPELEHTIVIYPYRKEKLRELKQHEYLGLAPGDISYVRLKGIDTSKMVMLQSATFRTKKDFNAHRLLRAIDNNTLLSKLPVSEQAEETHKVLSREQLHELYSEFPEIIENTEKILNQCAVTFDFNHSEHQNQKTYTGSEEEDERLLENLCMKGLFYRYPDVSQQVYERIEKELKTIKKMQFVSYFLMNWDIVSYARSKGYFYVGRGSGANSIVAYLLRITDVDPIELDLYFERFINLYRTNPPDFDIDFSWKDREDITRYIFERFDHVALVATYNTFKDRAVMRELGKVFGLPKDEIDKLSRGTLQPWELNHLSELVVKYAKYIHGFPSHLSVHASGIIISEQPVESFSATFLPPKGYPTIQFDMHVAEDVGLYKFDILSQRGLSKIKDALEIIKQNAPEAPEVDIHNMPMLKTDERVKAMLKEAQPIGCFYVESPAMRMLLKKLQVDNYTGLVAASSVIRPGVAKSGMMQEYIRRYRHPEKRKEAHPVLLGLMPETYGVMVYQEDVIKVAHHFAGLTLGEADKMRRGMSGKFRSREEFQAVKRKFFSNCIEVQKHSEELTREVWRQTESFAGYAFAKGHSASYAVESYQCLYLKAYYPLEFMVATINNYGGFYRTELYVHEARLFGGIVHAPCVNNSDWDTTLNGKDIYLGFHLLRSFDIRLARRIVGERVCNGEYTDMDDFIERVPVTLEQIVILIRIDALRFTGKDKRSLLWEAHFKINKSAKPEETKDLFRVQPKTFSVPELNNSWREDAFDQIELLGFPLHNTFDLLTENEEQGVVLAKDLSRYEGEKVWVMGYLIHVKKTSTSGGERMYFGTFLDQEGAWLDTVHFPQIAKRFPFRGTGVYKVYGTVIVEYDCISIETEFMEKMAMIEDPRYAEVRDTEKEKQIVTWNMRKDYGKRTNRVESSQ